MTTIAPDLTGIQTPRIYASAEFATSDYEAAVELGRQFGLHLYPFQQEILKHLLAETPEGNPAITTVGVSVPRQNGKNAALEIFELYVLLVYKQDILHTAHEVPTAKAHQDRMVKHFEDNPELDGRAKIRYANGDLEIAVRDGGTLRFSARTKSAARGFSSDWLVIDEAQYYTYDQQAALRPIIFTSPNPVSVLIGTPPEDGTGGGVFKNIRSGILEGNTIRRAWLEWSAEPDCDLDDVEAWRQANPALGLGAVQLTTIEDERTDMEGDEATFMRERLGMWSTAKSGAVIDPRTWDLRTDPHSQVAGPQTLAVDAAPDRSTATISLAAQRQDGRWHVESIEQRSGIDWVPEVLLAMHNNPANDIAAVVIDDKNEAKKFIPELQKAGVPLILTNMAMMGAACEGFYASVMDNTLRHTGQPTLSASLSLARKRKINLGTSWAWSKSSASADLTPLVSVTLALYGARANHIAPQVKKKRGRIRSR